MMSREFSKEEPKGGIVADAMGLGKTIEVLAVSQEYRYILVKR